MTKTKTSAKLISAPERMKISARGLLILSANINMDLRHNDKLSDRQLGILISY